MTTLFGIMFWPTIATALIIFGHIVRLKAPTTYSSALSYVAVALFFIPIFTLLFWFFNGSQIIMVDESTFFIALGVFLLWYFPNRAISRQTTWVMLTLGLAGVTVGGWYLVGDFCIPRQHMDGIVEGKARDAKGGLAPFYRVYISGRPLNTTADLFDSFTVGERVSVIFGVASGTIFGKRSLDERSEIRGSAS